MKEYKLRYEVRWKAIPPEADVTVFEPNELPLFPGLQIVVISEPLNYEGLSVTHGSEHIATAMMRKYGVGPFGTAYVEHYRDEFPERVSRAVQKPSFDAVWYKWLVVNPGCPVKIEAQSPKWRSLPYYPYYVNFLEALKEPVPEWLPQKMLEEAQKELFKIGVPA